MTFPLRPKGRPVRKTAEFRTDQGQPDADAHRSMDPLLPSRTLSSSGEAQGRIFPGYARCTGSRVAHSSSLLQTCCPSVFRALISERTYAHAFRVTSDGTESGGPYIRFAVEVAK